MDIPGEKQSVRPRSQDLLLSMDAYVNGLLQSSNKVPGIAMAHDQQAAPVHSVDQHAPALYLMRQAICRYCQRYAVLAGAQHDRGAHSAQAGSLPSRAAIPAAAALQSSRTNINSSVCPPIPICKNFIIAPPDPLHINCLIFTLLWCFFVNDMRIVTYHCKFCQYFWQIKSIVWKYFLKRGFLAAKRLPQMHLKLTCEKVRIQSVVSLSNITI